MSEIQFRVAARTDAAGKYNPNAPLEGNEDNMFVDSDLAKGHLGEFKADVVVNLSDKGCLMVVADGMGGMNAGEVASAIAIKTVKDFFALEKLTESIYKDSKSRMRYMESVVEAADEAIKADSTSNPEHEGMGSTIIMGWLCGDEICLTWCGDSRAYLFRPGVGLRQVSKDHSYVQGLVDEGKITEAQAFDHPYGNIIVRSLGDPEKKAQPDSKCFKVYQGDIFMLCSDGLSGVLRDRKTYNVNGERLDTENLEDIIAAHRNSMAECRDCLFEAAQRNDWYDNVTAVLCEILGSDTAPHPVENLDAGMAKPVVPMVSNTPKSSHSKRIILFIVIAVVAFGLGVYLASRFLKNDDSTKIVTQAEMEETETVSDAEAKEAIDKAAKAKAESNKAQGKYKTDKDHNDKGEKKKGQDSEHEDGKTPPDQEDTKQIDHTNAPNNMQEFLEADNRDEQTNRAAQEQESKEKKKVNNTSEVSHGNYTLNETNENKRRVQISEEECFNTCEKSAKIDKQDNCIKYLKTFKNGAHRDKVELMFQNEYKTSIKTRINDCKSISEVDNICKEDSDLRISLELSEKVNTVIKKYVENCAKDRKKTIEKSKK